MKIYSLASGSKGNSFLVVSKETKILIDCGISCKNIKQKLSSLGFDLDDIDAIFITHEHIDHTKGLFMILKYYDIKVYLSEKVYKYLINRCLISQNAKKEFIDGLFEIKDMSIIPIELSHDSVECFGYVIEANEERALYLTDTGIVENYIFNYIKNIKYAIIEANHDVEMLKNGPYPTELQKRILSNCGHLSNEQAGELCKMLEQNGTKKIMLAHLSEINNTKDLARLTVEKYLDSNSDIELYIADQNEIVGFVEDD